MTQGWGAAAPRKAFLLIVALVGAVCYFNSIDASFQFDDYGNIVDNPFVEDLSYYAHPMQARESYYGGIKIGQFYSRILGYFTFALNYAMHGQDPRGYRAVNVAVHVLAGWFVYLIILELWRTPRMTGHRKHMQAAALLAALVFVAHPVQTQAVTYIVQRFSSLAALFCFMALYAYMRARRADAAHGRWWYALSVLCTVCAMKTKETAFVFPLALVFVEAMFYAPIDKRAALRLTPFFLTMALVPISYMDFSAPVGQALAEASRNDPSLSRWQYVTTQFRVVLTYLRLIVLPVGQNVDYDIPWYYGRWFGAQKAGAFILLASMAAGIYWGYRRHSESKPWVRVASFGAVWFCLMLSLESGLIPIKDPMFEHRLYMPMAGFCMALAACASNFRVSKAMVVGMVLVVSVLVVMTIGRNSVWQTEVTLWRDAVTKSPQKGRVHNSLGVAYAQAGMHEEAVSEFRQALALDANPVHRRNMAIALRVAGRPEESVMEHSKARETVGDDPSLLVELGRSYEAMGEMQKARESYEHALKVSAHDPNAHAALGDMDMAAGDWESAAIHYKEALESRPRNAQVRVSYARALLMMGKRDEGRSELREVLRIEPGNREAAMILQGL